MASDKIKAYFLASSVEYVSALSCRDTVKMRPYLIDRLPFVPQSVIVFLVPYYSGETENISRLIIVCTANNHLLVAFHDLVGEAFRYFDIVIHCYSPLM